jgi:hypothetical protein
VEEFKQTEKKHVAVDFAAKFKQEFLEPEEQKDGEAPAKSMLGKISGRISSLNRKTLRPTSSDLSKSSTSPELKTRPLHPRLGTEDTPSSRELYMHQRRKTMATKRTPESEKNLALSMTKNLQIQRKLPVFFEAARDIYMEFLDEDAEHW